VIRLLHRKLICAAIVPIAFGSLALADQLNPDESKACSLLMERMAVHDGVAPSQVTETWFCDVTVDPGNSHPDWWVIGLRSFRQCDGPCSNLRGWFGVNRKTGEIREWDLNEYAPGAPIRD
jgi:hypothetical protein